MVNILAISHTSFSSMFCDEPKIVRTWRRMLCPAARASWLPSDRNLTPAWNICLIKLISPTHNKRSPCDISCQLCCKEYQELKDRGTQANMRWCSDLQVEMETKRQWYLSSITVFRPPCGLELLEISIKRGVFHVNGAVPDCLYMINVDLHFTALKQRHWSKSNFVVHKRWVD